MRYILMAALIALFATTVKAQEVYTDTQAVRPASFCIEAVDAYELLLADNFHDMWAKKVEQGKCGKYDVEWVFGKTLSRFNDDRVVEIRIKLTAWQTVYAVWGGDLDAIQIKWQGQSDEAQAAWFAAQHNKHGEWCCDKSDGHWYDDALNPDGSVTLAGGHKLEPYKVLDNPNPTGRAVYWHTTDTDYCFAPGTLG